MRWQADRKSLKTGSASSFQRLGGLISFALAALAAMMSVSAAAAPSASIALAASGKKVACPEYLPSGTACTTGVSAKGSIYFMAVPKAWNGTLVLFAHGGPRLGDPLLEETLDDLQKFNMLVHEGYAWAGATYRRGGYGVRSAAADMDDLREIAWQKLGARPKLTILHGQSWGGNVAAKAAELYALDDVGEKNFDGVVLTSGVLAGGTRGYRLRVDLRAVYQFYCQNHPRSKEPQYPVWQGLPAGSTMTRDQLAVRVRECTGVGLPEAERSAEQKARLRNIQQVLGITEAQLLPNLAWATNTFQDLIGRLQGRNPFSNRATFYQGSDDDAALNAGIERFSADPEGHAQLAYDSDLSGLIVAPTITLHGIGDDVANICHESAYRRTIAHAGRSELLVQTFTDESAHSRLSAPAYPAIFAAMTQWISTRTRPTRADIAAACSPFAGKYGEPCRFSLTYELDDKPC